MCIAILQTPGTKLTDEALYNSHTNNDDGCGFAYTDGERIHIYKTLNYAEFLAAYNQAVDQYGATSHFLVHFRIKTHGKITADACHPFQVSENMAVIHNGIIPGFGTDKQSDTQVFASEILSQLPEGWEHNQAILTLISKTINNSKMVFLHANNTPVIIGEKAGIAEWKDGIWYSNTSYRFSRTYNFRSEDGWRRTRTGWVKDGPVTSSTPRTFGTTTPPPVPVISSTPVGGPKNRAQLYGVEEYTAIKQNIPYTCELCGATTDTLSRKNRLRLIEYESRNTRSSTEVWMSLMWICGECHSFLKNNHLSPKDINLRILKWAPKR